jgi:tRNA dimethylallyltransferase
MNRALVVLGPTSSGKTDLALALAKKFPAEIICCDSRQVYKGLDVGTGKLPSQNSEIVVRKQDGYWEMDGIKVWMLDVANPQKRYDVSEYVKEAEKVLLKIQRAKKLPIIVAGTGLYLKALIKGLPNLSIPFDLGLRLELEKLNLSNLQQRLKEISISKWNNLNNSERNNPRRLVRIIELLTLKPKKVLIKEKKSIQVLKIGLSLPKEILDKRIDERVVKRISQGMLQEADTLVENGLSLKRFRELGLEYGVLADFLERKIDKNRFVKNLQTKIHQYAKRQMTWFKKDSEIIWFDALDKNLFSKVEMLTRDWYNAKV